MPNARLGISAWFPDYEEMNQRAVTPSPGPLWTGRHMARLSLQLRQSSNSSSSSRRRSRLILKNLAQLLALPSRQQEYGNIET